MGVRKYLDVHQDHVSKDEMDRIDQCYCLFAVSIPIGWWILVPTPLADLGSELVDLENRYPSLLRVLELANELGASWVLIDESGEEWVELPKYDWTNYEQEVDHGQRH